MVNGIFQKGLNPIQDGGVGGGGGGAKKAPLPGFLL